MMQEKIRLPEELVKEYFNLVGPRTDQLPLYAARPYIKGLTEPLERILKHHDIRVGSKPLHTLPQLFPPPKDTTSFTKSTVATALDLLQVDSNYKNSTIISIISYMLEIFTTTCTCDFN